MIVDDDQVTVSLLETLLELDGFEVIIVRLGSNVIPKAEATSPDVIMLDYHLSDMEGTEVLHALRQHATLADIPVVVASGMDVSDKVLAAGAQEFITKPFEPSDLPVLFNRLIAD
jgi:CheY-like chemotaxis protein